MTQGPDIYQIKKYPNRRFYDTTRSRHVTQDELYRLVQQGNSIQVTDSNTGSDITNQVLAQMILERDPPKLDLFPAGLLHQVIQANQQILTSFVERYFNRALSAFLQSQQQFETFLRQAGVPEPSFTAPLQWARSLMPGMPGFNPATSQPSTPPASDDGSDGDVVSPDEVAGMPPPNGEDVHDRDESSDALRAQLAEMARRLEQLESAGSRKEPRKSASPRATRKKKSRSTR
jgi:polyhydroxyalkanoate synthesis repressor PhaR